METIICNEFGCDNEIHPRTMKYGKDFYVLSTGDSFDVENSGIYCKNCGIIILAEVSANGFEIVSRRQV